MAKHLLTVFHCVLAVAATYLGIAVATTMGGTRPVSASLYLIALIVVPMAIATRVAWAAGYSAGRQASDAPSPAGVPPR